MRPARTASNTDRDPERSAFYAVLISLVFIIVFVTGYLLGVIPWSVVFIGMLPFLFFELGSWYQRWVGDDDSEFGPLPDFPEATRNRISRQQEVASDRVG